MTFAFLIVILYQCYCFYHIYQNQDKAYWYIIILLFPFIGGLVYFLRNVGKGQGGGQFSITEKEIKPSFSPSKIKQLEAQVEVADTVTNKIRLADAYVEKERFAEAIDIYESCFNKFTEDDEELNEKLLAAFYLNNDFVNTIAFGKKLEDYRFFQNSKEKAYYAWAYFELNDDAMAEQIFEELNIVNTNFYHRLEFSKFLIETDRHQEAHELVDTLLAEINDMDAYEKKNLRETMKEIKVIKQKVLG